ncbi:DUF4917 family protein [Aliarcobacter butzleri]|uniref:DUF4917 family protein n=1 Tax=Aliarcobacter butzleri TaxID=28197 RepID=UPI001ED9EA0A|nr:DUF4917 family protein [Aliarcobacter butzleri]MCG3678434.1 DUF4917 family protein [Aliarcobacter butzleri]
MEMNKNYEFIDTYDEVIRRTENGKRYLLLGNGFSISYNKNRFSLKNLFDYAVNQNLISIYSPLYNIFKYFETYDFEKVIKKLEETKNIYFYNYNTVPIWR